MAVREHSWDVSAAHLLAIEDRLTALEKLIHEHLMRPDARAVTRAWYAWADEEPVQRCASCEKAHDRGDGFVYCTHDPADWVVRPSARPACSEFVMA